jgi:formylglycine-generating enzyme required for sulfatase activity
MNVQNALSANVTTLMNVQNALSANVTTLRNQVTSASSNASAALQMVVDVGNATTLMNEKNALSANVTTLLAMVQSLRKELEEVNAFEIMISVQGGTLPQSSRLKGQTVAAFQIGKYEVTWGLWKRVRDWAVTNGYSDLAGVGDTYPSGSGDNFPVCYVSWYDVVKWCNARSEKEGLAPVYAYNGNFTYNGTTYGNGTTYRAGQTDPTVNASANGYRLPSEKEWEWAARGGVSSKSYTYSGSNTANDVAWTAENSSDETKMVGTKSANELGIYDMSGNVWEWCGDVFTFLRYSRGGGFFESAIESAPVAGPNSYAGPARQSGISGFRQARSSGN